MDTDKWNTVVAAVAGQEEEPGCCNCTHPAVAVVGRLPVEAVEKLVGPAAVEGKDTLVGTETAEVGMERTVEEAEEGTRQAESDNKAGKVGVVAAVAALDWVVGVSKTNWELKG